MKESTRQALLAINRRFYDDGASRFSATRQRPWEGWRQLLPELREAAPGRTCLDVGCGNGRFAAFLAAEGLLPARYLGLDGSVPLLAEARATLPDPPFAFRQVGLDELEEIGPHPPAPLSEDGEGGEPNMGGGTPLQLPRIEEISRAERIDPLCSFRPVGLEELDEENGPHPPAPLSADGEGGEPNMGGGTPLQLPRIEEISGAERPSLDPAWDAGEPAGAVRRPEGDQGGNPPHIGSPPSPSAERGAGGRGPESFDLIVLFGVLHHVPGRAARRAFLEALSSRVAPGGLLVVSFWLLDRFPSRFEKLRLGDGGLELEEGDALLSFDGRAERPRYCHFPDDAEIDELCRLPGCEEARRFRADGPSGADNLYAVLRRVKLPAPSRELR